MAKVEIVCTRLIDMVRHHPQQDNTKACSRCGSVVGMYPTGQRALAEHPEAVLVCLQCAVEEPDVEGTIDIAAGSFEEFVQEISETFKAPSGNG